MLKTRRNKLKDKIKKFLLISDEETDLILVMVDEYEKSNLEIIAKLNKKRVLETKRISGGLKQTINSHGPITKQYIGSATKRIYGALLSNEVKKLNLFKRIMLKLKL